MAINQDEEHNENLSAKRALSSSPPAPSVKMARTDMLTVPVKSADHYRTSQGAALLQQPVQIASFSYDERRNLHHDDRARRFYHAPPPRADLNRGFEAFVERDDTINEHLDSLLLSLIRLAEQGKDEERRRAGVITWRGMMTKLCTVLYEDRQDFEMNAMMVGDTLYLEEHVGPAQKADKTRQQQDPKLKRFTYYGYSFESWTCSQEKTPDNMWDGDVNTNVQWCSIVKTKLGDLRCILAGEVDAIDSKTHAPVEVKTSMQIRSVRDEERFETKMLRFYMQSFLLGVALVVVGFRDFRGFLVTHQQFQTLAMPRAVRGKPHAWDPTACLNLAEQLLSSIRSHLAATIPGHPIPLQEAEKSAGYPVHRVRFDHVAKTITVIPLDPSSVLHEVKGGRDEGRVGFLLSSYYQSIL